MKNHFRERKVVLMDINNVSKAPKTAKAAEATNQEHKTSFQLGSDVLFFTASLTRV